MVDTTLKRIAAIQRMERNELIAKWQELYGTELPDTINTGTLKSRLIYRVQKLAYGGLSAETVAKLEKLGTTIPEAATPRKTKRKDKGLPVPGTKLIRDYKGETYEVTVTETGFEYQGRPYKTLSAIASEITGSHWNGNVFFGLKKRKKKSK